MTYTLGPCPCQGCGRLVYWNRLYWGDKHGTRHRCPS
jgi:hypothetical protein